MTKIILISITKWISLFYERTNVILFLSLYFRFVPYKCHECVYTWCSIKRWLKLAVSNFNHLLRILAPVFENSEGVKGHEVQLCNQIPAKLWIMRVYNTIWPVLFCSHLLCVSNTLEWVLYSWLFSWWFYFRESDLAKIFTSVYVNLQ